jgi:hypothetical protein
MSSPSTTDVSDEIIAAAGEFIRSYEAVVAIYELLDELGDRFPGFVTPDMRKLVIKALSRYLKYVVAQLIVELWRWISVGALVFQAAASSAVASRQTAKR